MSKRPKIVIDDFGISKLLYEKPINYGVLHDGMSSWKLSVSVGGVAGFPRQNTPVAAGRYGQATKLELPG
jgi:hypothetical protein